jgi:type IV pilus assembly protein PilW
MDDRRTRETEIVMRQQAQNLRPAAVRGFTLIELMVGIFIGMLVVAGLAVMFANSSQSYGEMQKQSQQIENGRYAFDVLRDDLEHAGFFGSRTQLPTVPGTEPDPCDISTAALASAISLPIQAYDSPATSPLTCLANADHVPGTDILVIRRADPLVLTAAPTSNEIYVQASASGIEVQAGNPSGFALPALNADNTVQAVGTKATGGVAPTVKKMMNVAGASPVVTIQRVAADIRKLHVHIYFIAPCSRPAPGQAGCTAAADGGTPIPTLKRLELDLASGAAALNVRPIAEGIENIQLEYGFDTTPAAINAATGFRGDGVIDAYSKDVTGVGGGTYAEWPNVMSTRLYVLARNPQPTSGFTDNKTYAMGLEGTYTPANKTFRRHLFEGEIRLINLSSRREIPK